jgi:hypothetical protein
MREFLFEIGSGVGLISERRGAGSWSREIQALRGEFAWSRS